MKTRDRCLSDGELRALLDAPGAPPPHLDGCAACQARLARLRETAEAAGALLAQLGAGEAIPDPALAYRRLVAARRRPLRSSPKGVPLMHRLLGAPRRAGAAGVAAIALLVAVIAFAPVGSLAQDILNSFRVQQFAAITIPMDVVDQFAAQAGAQVSQLTPAQRQQIAEGLQGLDKFSSTLGSQSVRQVGSLDEARAHLGGTLRVPADLPAAFAATPPQVYVGDGGHLEYTIDVAKAQQVLSIVSLKPGGLPDPAQTPEVTVSLDINPAAMLHYTAGDQHLIVGQTASPVLNIPSAVDVEALREAILSVPGLPPDLVAQIRAVKDWQHTLIIPVPAGATTSQEKVDGAPALLIEVQQGAARSPSRSSPSWRRATRSSPRPACMAAPTTCSP
ncbi:MAG: hypothetical protein QJR03_07445 [Sphaerobacter sp.]|nr:hypothetical protein [Sphaerobacter sp.]